jgi:hypothetical protein
LKVTLGTLKDKGDDLAAFLEPRVGSKPSVSGGTIEIEDEGVREGVKPRHVKTYIKRFLYVNGIRKNYRVFVSGKELTVQEIILGEEEEEEKKKAPEKKEEEEAVEEKAETPQPDEAEAKEPEMEEKEAKPKKAAAKKPRAAKKRKADDS